MALEEFSFEEFLKRLNDITTNHSAYTLHPMGKFSSVLLSPKALFEEFIVSLLATETVISYKLLCKIIAVHKIDKPSNLHATLISFASIINPTILIELLTHKDEMIRLGAIEMACYVQEPAQMDRVVKTILKTLSVIEEKVTLKSINALSELMDFRFKSQTI